MSVGRKPRKPLRRLSSLRRGAPVKARNPKRRASEFARCYGSRARVNWIRSLPCVGCAGYPSENAHTGKNHAGYKADADTIAPLCRRCHRAYDEHRAPFDTAFARKAVQVHAAFRAAQWERMGQFTPLAAIVPGVVADLLERAEDDA